MDEDPREDEHHHPDKRFSREVGRQAQRKLQARSGEHRSVWFWLGMFGIVGWSVVVPTLVGVAIGMWMDRAWPGELSWTLTMLFVGVVLGALNAWYWVKQEIRNH